MSERYGRGRLKDMVIDALMYQADHVNQVLAVEQKLVAALNNHIRLQEQHTSDLAVIEYWKAAAETNLGIDFFANADAAQNGPNV